MSEFVTKYFVSVGDDENEVDRLEFIAVERACGFMPVGGIHDACATAGFSKGVISGRIEISQA